MTAMRQWKMRLALGVAAMVLSGCQSPSTADDALEIDDILVTTSPESTGADIANDGRTYRVVRGNNQPDEILAFDWKTTFSIGLRFTDAADDDDAMTFPISLSSVGVKVQQASGGIVTPPTGGDIEHFEYVTQASSNRFAAVGSTVDIVFDVWYDLPSLKKEALVTVTLAFVDDDGVVFSKSVDVKVTP